MLVTVEFADAGTKSGSHRVLIIGRGMQDRQPGDIEKGEASFPPEIPESDLEIVS